MKTLEELIAKGIFIFSARKDTYPARWPMTWHIFYWTCWTSQHATSNLAVILYTGCQYTDKSKFCHISQVRKLPRINKDQTNPKLCLNVTDMYGWKEKKKQKFISPNCDHVGPWWVPKCLVFLSVIFFFFSNIRLAPSKSILYSFLLACQQFIIIVSVYIIYVLENWEQFFHMHGASLRSKYLCFQLDIYM